jgi:hypothetical protein
MDRCAPFDLPRLAFSGDAAPIVNIDDSRSFLRLRGTHSPKRARLIVSHML